jgi:subtilisin family serine protease
MSHKAIVTRRSSARSPQRAAALADTAAIGLEVEHELPSGSLVAVPDTEGEEIAELEARGYRVKLLSDTNLIYVGTYVIDIESGEPTVPANLEIPAEEAAIWSHHLVQLAAPPTPDWIAQIEALGLDVAEPISAYALFVRALPAELARLRDLSFVVWTGPFKPAYRIAQNLQEQEGRIQYVNVGIYPAEAAGKVKERIAALNGAIHNEWGQDGNYRDRFHVLIIEIDSAQIPALACVPDVRWLSFQAPKMTADDERTTQIIAQNFDGAPPPATAPVIGYQTALGALGLSGSGVVIGICDSGVSTNTAATMHPDLKGRLRFFQDTTGGLTPQDVGGHGTHVAGIALGSAGSGSADPQGFLLGQGVAPGAEFGVLNPVDTNGGPGTNPFADFTTSMVTHGAQVMNNSWRQGPASGYSANAALADRLVRDPNHDDLADPQRDYLVIVFSAGNDGPASSSITEPKEAKNPIIVGNCANHRPGEHPVTDVRGVSSSSSRGPAADGRILPTIVAPGTRIVSARSNATPRPGSPYTDTSGNIHADHTPLSGTSMAAPHVAGLCALLIEWWRLGHEGANPSTAMLKALLVNAAEDLVGGPDGKGGTLGPIPNNDQGWGRVCLRNIVQDHPASSRGPKLLFDQQHPLTENGAEFLTRIVTADTGRPLRITLAWTDAPGAADANPALTNDLDLEVVEVSTGTVFKGNVFANGFSVAGGNFDGRNNVECIYVRNPSSAYEVRVIAASLTADARPPFRSGAWQDFALVIDNARAATP